MTTSLNSAQIVILGAGPVGLACAIWLLENNPDLHLILLDKNPSDDQFLASGDERGIAISEGSKQLLENIHAWVKDAPAIHYVHVSHRGHFGQTMMSKDEIAQSALGHIVRYRDIMLALRHRLRHLQTIASHFEWVFEFSEPMTLDQLSEDACLVHADGGLFHEQSAKDRHKDYGQSALVGSLEVSDITADMAWERFTEEGPIAILPHHQGPNFKNFVWCASKNTIDRLVALEEKTFLLELQEALHLSIGKFLHVFHRKSYPLGLNIKQHIVADREVWIGNAAQTLHPVAGQGLNLGLRDAHTLATSLNYIYARPSEHLGEDLQKTLSRYQQLRQTDRNATIRVTDLMASVFATNALPFVISRGLALSALQWLPPLKNKLARQMMFGQR
jgi:2-octaprenyl-6-methoxyphenol hydroxylase